MKKICLFLFCLFAFIPLVYGKNITTTKRAKEKNNTIKEEDCKKTCLDENCDENTCAKTSNEAKEDGIINDGKSAILIESSTGKVLYEKNSHDRYAPASMTKIMSMLIILESIEKGNLKWNEKLITSKYAASMGGSQIFLQENEKMSVEDLFKAVAVGSANDATIVLAEKVAGSEDNFVKKMNEKARSLGLKDTNFKNAVGLDTANHYSTAYDMAMIARELIKHEKIFSFTTIYEDYLRQNTDNKFWLVNTNKLIKTYEGADGLKTGYTKEAGYCLTATANRNRMRIIGTIMGSSSSNSRNENMKSLLDYGFNNYEMQVEVKQGKTVSKKMMPKAENEVVNIVPIKDASVLLKKGEEKKSLNYEIKINKVKLPIKKGDIVGILKLKDGTKVISTTNLTVKNDVKKVSILKLYKRSIASVLSGSM